MKTKYFLITTEDGENLSAVKYTGNLDFRHRVETCLREQLDSPLLIILSLEYENGIISFTHRKCRFEKIQKCYIKRIELY